MDKTIIRWQVVNTRKKDKNYPELGRKIVYKLYLSKYYCKFTKWGADPEQIATGIVSIDDGGLCVSYGDVKLPFENGFQWCYWEDIEDVLNGVD